MKKLIFLLAVFLSFFSLYTLSPIPYTLNPSRADELDDVSKKLSEEQKRLADLEKKKQQLAKDISSASASLSSISAQLSEAEKELTEISAALAEKEEILAKWEKTRNFLIREAYKLSRVSSLEIIFSSDDFADATKQAYYHEKSIEDLKERISAISAEIVIFRQNKEQAEKLRNDLADLRNQYLAILASRRSSLSSTDSQLSSVKQSIKGLTARQEQLILEKFAKTSQSGTVGDKEPISTPLPPPTFSPAFAFATYGYPHRVGMNQYGAYGRALDGQGYGAILQAYYQSTGLQKVAVPATITVADVNRGSGCKVLSVNFKRAVSFEDEYLDGIAEMPTSWHIEALKAQAVAARSFAIVTKNSGKYSPWEFDISDDTCDQAYRWDKKGNPANNNWEKAVDDTRSEALVYAGSVIPAYYASTAGGYTLSSAEVWGGYRAWALGIKDFGPKGAYDGPAYGNSPWYHKAWGSRTGSGYDPWITEEEAADIFNALLLSKYSSSYNQYLSPVDQGGWGFNQVKQELRNLGISPVEKISALLTTSDDAGHTASVLVCQPPGNPYPCGSPLTYSGKDFRAMFNLRSRGSLVIWTSLYDLIRP